MIFVTGDTHCEVDYGKLLKFVNETPGLTKNDYMIIAGDFGGVWFEPDLEHDLDLYSTLPFTTLFVDGNHENFELLNAYPVTTWHGGKVQMIRPDIIHLMRGQVYEIEGKTFFTFGGATSTDRNTRIEGISWWREELPTLADFDEGVKNLAAHNNCVDFIITHSCGERSLYYPPLLHHRERMHCYPENKMLAHFEDTVKFRHWYFGHYHMDGDLTEEKTVLYQNIIRLT